MLIGMGENRENEIGIRICVDLGWKTRGNEIEMGINVDSWSCASFCVLGCASTGCDFIKDCVFEI